jgi:glycosyltransferase involved in cell wall biosynthesis
MADPRAHFSVLAFADEIADDPSLLAAWAGAFDGADAATLVIYAPDRDEQAMYAALVGPIMEAGLEEDGTADVLALPIPASAKGEVELTQLASAVLTRREPADIFRFLPRFAPEDAAALRAAAEDAWAARPAAAPARRHALAICSILREEGRYVREFVEFHRIVGVEHFYLYDNGSTDDTAEVLAPYVDEGIVTYIHFPHPVAQVAAYNHCARTFGDESEWIAFMDADEFFFAPGGDDLREALREFDGYGAVHVNYANYGTSGHEMPPDEPIIAAYTWRGRHDAVVPYPHLLKAPGLDPDDLSNYHALDAHITSVVRPDRVLECKSPHHWTFREGWFGVTENHEPHFGPWTKTVSMRKLRFNHYWTKSVEDCRRKFERGRASTNKTRAWPHDFLERNAVLNDVEDREILVHLDALRAALAPAYATS